MEFQNGSAFQSGISEWKCIPEWNIYVELNVPYGLPYNYVHSRVEYLGGTKWPLWASVIIMFLINGIISYQVITH